MSDVHAERDVTAAEPHSAGLASRLNWLRAGVLGANDGIVSTAGVVVGVSGATSDHKAILVAGVAALAAGALSMAAGEFVSVSTQCDSERALLTLERHELRTDPDGELEELTRLYEAKGISRRVAEQVAAELTSHDALAAHAEVELGLDPESLTNPWHAAWASMVSFVVGALLPLVTITFAPEPVRLVVTVVSVIIALGLTGWTSARLGRSPAPQAVLRTVGGGVLAMVVTFAIGRAFGVGMG
ncbi:MAG TPA: VIT family protein [Intrasporangium sp.]|uniref:VIT1/CCC1 transporter family protein n=1 Tax=Intrasporangium sp. TaxID=1925024 RepID=UPI002D7A09E1|nr:VIT family protein [Intrasporangium sp.]HET7397157.1 VIT family protein [Intrasporangium sp.]